MVPYLHHLLGVVATEINGEFHIVAGHHRVEAAIASGITQAEVFFGEFTPEKIVEIYARENATQRGNGGTAQTGSVAGALRLVAYRNMVESKAPQFGEPLTGDQKAGQGIGAPQITAALDGVPGLGSKKVEEQLANLKASGHYTRIINEVAARVEAEAKEQEAAALAAAEEAERRAKELEDARIAAERAGLTDTVVEKRRYQSIGNMISMARSLAWPFRVFMASSNARSRVSRSSRRILKNVSIIRSIRSGSL